MSNSQKTIEAEKVGLPLLCFPGALVSKTCFFDDRMTPAGKFEFALDNP